DTPPMGVSQGSTPPAGTTPPSSTPPQGTYAMGALAGNPALGQAPGASYGTPPPTDPGTPMWGAPVTPATSAGNNHHRVRNGLLAGAAALAVLGAGIGIGHATTSNNGSSTQAFAPSSGTSRVPSGSGSSGGSGASGNPFGNGSPFGGAFGGSGSSGSSGNGNSGSSNSSGPSDVNAIASKVDPGLVDINTTLGYQQEQAAGTGIVLSSNGVILTNNHVIDGATTISVTDIGNKKTYKASVVGYDRTKDIAVLQLQNASGLQTAILGNSSNASVCQDVVGVGNAGGTGGTPSAAGGTVTALNQSITASDQGDGTSEQLNGLIETNADIQPGDSGGALVDTSGNVLGIDTAASAGFSFQSNNQSSGNQGYAIPINTALSLARAIEAGNGSSTIHIGETAFLGVEINASGASSGNGGNGNGNGNGGGGFGGFFGGNSGSTGNTGSTASGASVASVVTNGPAQEAGLAEGDVITSLGGKSVGSANDLTSAMSTYHPGDKVAIGWTDGSGQTHTATVQLSSGPPQ
ncbi:MAG TPA: trypsin-like peptidase domain-containing protein, partial [Acidimicrobiales bacterium]|nr:trypsin-like peptidase domain-containing protein [Acidimicrobiales bacterium]